jgi:hypothetical protein
MGKELTSKSTKNEILSAYQDLVAAAEAGAATVVDKKAEIKAKGDKAVVTKVAGYTVENIATGLVNLKLRIGNTLAELTEQLSEEANKLPEIRQAIIVETAKLEEIHNITVAADTLSVLIMAQEQKKVAFETEMTENKEKQQKTIDDTKSEWDEEFTQHNIFVKETNADLTKTRARNKEDYDYTLSLQKRNNADDFAEKKKTQEKELETEREEQEKELTEREDAVEVLEDEMDDLKEKVENFSAELAEAVKKAEGRATGMADSKAKQTAQLLAKDAESEKRLADLKISSLEVTISNQDDQLGDLGRQLSTAQGQVQKMAVGAIESVSGSKALSAVNDIALEQAKSPNTKK